MLESVHLNGDDEEDDYYLDDDYEDEDDRPARKGLFAKKDEDDYYDDDEEYDQKPRFLSRSPKVVPNETALHDGSFHGEADVHRGCQRDL